MSDMQMVLNYAMETAKKLGAQGVRAGISQAQSFSIDWRKQKIDQMQSDNTSSLFLNLFVDGRYGNFMTSDMRKESLETFIQKGIDMTRLLEADECRGLAEPEKYANRAEIDLDLYDAKIPDIKPEYHIDICKKIEELGYGRSELPVFDVQAFSGHSYSTYMLATSNGFFGTRKGSSCYNGLSIVLNDGDKKPSEGYSTSARYLSDLAPIETTVDIVAKYAAYTLGQKKLASGKRTVIMDRSAAARFLEKYLEPLYGMALVQKQSYFLDKIGQKMGSDLLTLIDMPHIVRGISSRLFDGEGISTHDASIFENGTLKQYFLDTYAARKLKLDVTSGSRTNLVLKPGSRSLEAMIADVKDGIYLTGFLGGNKDNVRGDFSYGITGVAIQDGKLTQNISEMNIDGNALDIWNRLVEVGNDPRLDNAVRVPSLRFDDVSFSGT